MDYLDVIRRVLARVEKMGVRAPTSGEVRAATVLVEELRPLSLEQRALVIQNRRAYRTALVAERILRVAQDDAAEDPQIGLEWLDTLNAILDLPELVNNDATGFWIPAVTVRKQALRAITCARIGRHDDAELILSIASEMDCSDPFAAAELEEAKGLLAAFRQRLEAALGHFAVARDLYVSIGDRHLAARVDLRTSFAYAESRQYPRAIDFALTGCAALDERRDPRLLLAGLFNLARYLKDGGRLEGSLSVIERARRIFQQLGKRTDFLRLAWFEAGVHAEREEWPLAVVLYRDALEGFSDLGHVFEVAAIAIEAAEAFDRAGRGEETLPLLAVAVSVMSADGCELDMIAAWTQLRNAVQRDVATAALFAAAREKLDSLETGHRRRR